MGLAPSEFWNMHLWEYNLRVHVFNEQQKNNARLDFYQAHATAALTSQGFAGKLRAVSHYIGDGEAEDTQNDAETLTDEQMEAIDRELLARSAERK